MNLSHGRALSVGERELGEHEGAWAQALGPNGELLAVGKLSIETAQICRSPDSFERTNQPAPAPMWHSTHFTRACEEL